MKLAFLRSKISKEQLEKEAGEELQAAMARATPPTESERTWAYDGPDRSTIPAERPRVPAEPSFAPTASHEVDPPRAGVMVDVDELRTELWAEPDEAQPGPGQTELDDVDLDDVDLDDVPPGGQVPPDYRPRTAKPPAPRPATRPAGSAKKVGAKPAARKSSGSTRTRSPS